MTDKAPTPLAAFLDRWDDLKVADQQDLGPHDFVAPGGYERAAAAMAPLLGRVAERAGVDVDDLAQGALDRIAIVPGLILGRVVATHGDLQVELARALRDVYADAFLAGAMWEQERHLPDPGAPTDG